MYYHPTGQFGGVRREHPRGARVAAREPATGSSSCSCTGTTSTASTSRPAASTTGSWIRITTASTPGPSTSRRLFREEGLDRGRLTLRDADVHFWRAVYDEKIAARRRAVRGVPGGVRQTRRQRQDAVRGDLRPRHRVVRAPPVRPRVHAVRRTDPRAAVRQAARPARGADVDRPRQQHRRDADRPRPARRARTGEGRAAVARAQPGACDEGRIHRARRVLRNGLPRVHVQAERRHAGRVEAHLHAGEPHPRTVRPEHRPRRDARLRRDREGPRRRVAAETVRALRGHRPRPDGAQRGRPG